MKKTKKLAAVLLALVMLVAFAIPAFAQTGDYSITIIPTTANHTYTAYQIFKGDITGTDTTTDGTSGYTLSNIEWGSDVNGTALLDALKLADNGKYGTCTTAADVAGAIGTTAADADAFATIVSAHLTGQGTSVTSEGDSATITLTEAGYYLVTDTLNGTDLDDFVSDYIVQVLGDESLAPKGDKATIEKKVYEESLSTTTTDWGNGYNDVADYDIGDDVPFKLVASIPDMTGYDGYQFVITDTLSAGLTLKADSFDVYVASGKDVASPGNGPLTAATDYTLNTAPGDGTSFTITLNDMEENANLTGADDNYLIVTYEATLNKNAEIGLDGNPNEVDLTYSNNPNGTGTGKTPKDYAVVFTYELDGTKVDELNAKLGGAEFVLLNNAGTQVAKIDDAGKLDGWVSVPAGTGDDGAITYEDWTTFNGTNKVIMTSAELTGAFGISGLDEGTYKLREIEAPAGYNILANDISFEIAASTGNVSNYTGSNANTILNSLTIKVGTGGATEGNEADGTVSIQVVNEAGTTLPETGGMGTTIFYVLGGLLVVGAGVLLIVRFRMRATNNE